MQPKTCSYCGNHHHYSVFTGQTVSMCSGCAQDILKWFHSGHENDAEPSTTFERMKTDSTLSPIEIKNQLDETIIGQRLAKMQVSLWIHNHLKRIQTEANSNLLPRFVGLLLGESGTGKTFIVEQAAKLTQLPFVSVDASSLTATGWSGADADSILESLYIKSGNKKELAEKGIIYIDEIDKLFMQSSGDHNHMASGAQIGLLKILEGAIIPITPDKRPSTAATTNKILFDTKNILFICGGSFSGLEEITRQRTDHHSIGFIQEANGKKAVMPTKEDFIQFGVLPELFNRINSIVRLHPLSTRDLYEILTKSPQSIIAQYKKFFALENCNLQVSKKALKYIAHKAIQEKANARGLIQQVHKVMFFKSYSTPNSDVKDVLITEKLVKKCLQ